jgi:hypothetical protein
MNVQTRAGNEPFYPIVANHIADDPTPKDQAIYVPSVTPGFAMDVHAKNWKRPLPRGVDPEDLNFLDPANKLFRISHVMSSAGQAMSQNKPCIINTRDRQNTLMIGDSGGYQIASGRLAITCDSDRLNILRWLENNADVAMTLDVPTGPVRKAGYKYKTAKDCLKDTLDHLEFFRRHRTEGAVRFLNVLQGNTTVDSDSWYDAVKPFEFEGWAFAGILRHNFYNLCRRLLRMAHEKQLDNKSWIHVLGTTELETAVMLTALQRAINKHINPNIRISFDTSTPFRMLSWNDIYTVPRFGTDRIVMETDKIPDGPELVDSSVRWPWPSALGDRMTLGDIVVKGEGNSGYFRDQQSWHLLAHHNLSALCNAVSVANRVYDSESIQHRHTIALAAGDAVAAIERVFAAGSETQLQKEQSKFRRLRHGKEPRSDDELRALLDE